MGRDLRREPHLLEGDALLTIFEFLGWATRLRTQWKLHCRYSDVERGASRISPRPWLAIHGEKDAYIGVDIARGLFDRAGEPKELWIVAKAKHNRCREKDPVAYAGRVESFFRRYAPRVLPEPVAIPEAVPFADVPLSVGVGVAVPN